MKSREFHIRLDQDPSAQNRRLYAYIRSILPGYKVPGRMERKIKAKRAAKLIRVK